MRVGFAAAGSGGHVFPALAVADELARRGVQRDDIVFFGGDRMEATTVPAAGYPFVGVDIHGIRRSLSVDNLTLPRKVFAARNRIAEEITARRLQAMVVFGGYISGPAALASARTGVPLIVHEANAVPGVANRLVARRATTVYAAFAPTGRRLQQADVIGSPLRQDFTDFDRAVRRTAGREKYGLDPDAVVLGVVGGSLGAQFLNEVATELGTDPERAFSIVHLTGTLHHEAIAARAGEADDWRVIAFEEDMAGLYAACDLVLSRAGAMTVSELQATHTPAIVVPLPAGKGYQAENAADLAASGGGIIEPQSEPEIVASAVRELIGDQATLGAMARAIPAVDHGRAASIMATRILEVDDA